MTATLKIETFPNKAAADYTRGKAVADPQNFGRLPAELRQRAFTAAGIEQMDALRRLRDTIAKLPEGSDWEEVRQGLASQISPFIGSGDAESVMITIPAGKTVATLHTHPNGDSTPSPADLFDGFHIDTQAEYVAAGKKLRRWTWLKTPDQNDADKLKDFNARNKAGKLDFKAYNAFLDRLVRDGYIKMEVLA